MIRGCGNSGEVEVEGIIYELFDEGVGVRVLFCRGVLVSNHIDHK